MLVKVPSIRGLVLARDPALCWAFGEIAGRLTGEATQPLPSLRQPVLVSARRDADAARRFFRRALSALMMIPSEVVTDAALVYP